MEDSSKTDRERLNQAVDDAMINIALSDDQMLSELIGVDISSIMIEGTKAIATLKHYLAESHLETDEETLSVMAFALGFVASKYYSEES